MFDLLSQAFARLNSLLKKVQVKSLISAVFLGTILLTSGYIANDGDRAITANEVDSEIFEGDSVRPTTTNEWYEEAEETDGVVEKAKRIGKETGAAVKEMGELYPDVADRTVSDDLK